MTLYFKATALTVLLLSKGSDAFAPTARFGVNTAQHSAFGHARRPLAATLWASSVDQEEKVDNQVDRLRTMAAQLRNETSMLEANLAKEKAQAAEKAFRKFDIDQDGKISLLELRAGLEKALKLELSEVRVQRLMDTFDGNGDGALEAEEFVGVDKLRNALDQITRQERQESLVAKQKEQAAQQGEKLLAFLKDSINEKEATNVEKVLSVLPYLFPLLDSVQFGQFLLAQNQDNPLVQGLVLLFGLYRAIPLSGFIAFFALSFLGDNLAINKLIRFNMKQSIFLDVALFFPSILASIGALAANAGNFQLPEGIVEMGSDAVFAAMLLAIGYSSVSSLLGATPDKIPFISDAVSQRMPSIDMFDGPVRFIEPPKKKDDNKKDDKEDE